MLKSFSNMFNRIKKKRNDQNLANFDNYVDEMKQDILVLNKLIEDYKLDANKPLVPQIEKHLGRGLTEDEKQSLAFVIKAIRDGAYHKVKRLEGKTYHHSSGKKKKKKK